MKLATLALIAGSAAAFAPSNTVRDESLTEDQTRSIGSEDAISGFDFCSLWEPLDVVQ
jgi:hypothetical protein